MKAFLTQERSGAFMLTAQPPEIVEVGGSGVKNAYVPYGDPLGLRHLCHAGVTIALAEHGQTLPPKLTPVEVDFVMRQTAGVRDCMTCRVWWTRMLSRFDLGWRITCATDGGQTHPVYQGRSCWRGE